MEEEKKVYGVVELLGHRKVIGIISESRYSPGSLLRVDVLNSDGGIDRTEHVGTGSIYCLTEVSEEVALLAAKGNVSKPSVAWDIPQSRQISAPRHFDDDYGSDEEG